MKVVTAVGLEVLGKQASLKLRIQDYGECKTYNNLADIDQLDALRVACSNVAEILGEPLCICEPGGFVTTLTTISGKTVKFGLLEFEV